MDDKPVLLAEDSLVQPDISLIAGQEEDYKPDIMAPGGSASYYSSILSVDSNSSDGAAFGDQQPNDYYNIQGTSMASPHIAGLGAYLLSFLGPRSGTALCDYIKSTAQTSRISGIPSGTGNRLAFNGNPTA
jgi:subtilisin family serine protease